MTIKDVAKLTGLSNDTLRYYEKIGLIPKIPRDKNGIRIYDEHIINWIQFILKFKEAGASLEIIIKYIELLNSKENTKTAREKILFEIKDDLNKKINNLKICLELIEFKIENQHTLCDPIMKKIIDNI